MRTENKKSLRVCLAGLLLACLPLACWADDLDTMGATLLRASHPTLLGTGIPVAQAEAILNGTADAFEVNPSATNVDQPESLFQWISTNGDFTDFPNADGTESFHSDDVAALFYAPTTGVAPGVASVANYEADYFFAYTIENEDSINAQVVNQSFAFFPSTVSEQQEIDSIYDDYIAEFGNLFSSAPNGINDSPGPPGTAYNGIGVSDYGAGAELVQGPTLDNGRSKPDMVAPGTTTSATIPYVAGAAAVLMQAAAAGDGGTPISDASNLMTIKALLLNGALKPYDWTHTTTMPLDTRYGAGVLNLYYSYQQLAGGKQAYTSENRVSSGGAHPPVSTGTAIGALAGWDYESPALLPTEDTVNHYLFNIAGNSTLTATLDWERHIGETSINNLALFLYNATNATLLTNSVSLVDNVQHIYIPHLPPGKYDLEVVYYYAHEISLSETYALAFQFFPMSPPDLSISDNGINDIITWPWSPTVYTLQETSSLRPPATWTNVAAAEWITNTTVWTSVANSGSTAYFRLVR